MKKAFALLLAAMLAGCAGQAPRDGYPPIVFVHGAGDSAAVWYPTVWRFESNGWPRERLFAPDLPYPVQRDDDRKPQDGRSSTAESTANLAAEIERVRKITGANKVVLFGLSRGGFPVRDYVRNNGAGNVSHVVLGGTPNHGIWAGDYLPGSEFNGKGPFLTKLNLPQGADALEVTPGVAFMMLRSDNYDKYAQPDGLWIGQPKMRTNVTFDSPALNGAENVVLPGLDHREVALHAAAFVRAFRFVTGQAPERNVIVPETSLVLDGRITGFRGNDATNLPLPGASIEIFETDAQTGDRVGAAVHARTVAGDGQWGPFAARTGTQYEFVIRAEGYAITHIYRPPFARSTNLLHMRPARIAAADMDAGSLVTMTRPRGYFGAGRDAMALDGKSPPGIAPGVAGLSASKLKLDESTLRSVAAEFNGERIVVRSWPARENHVVFAEFHY